MIEKLTIVVPVYNVKDYLNKCLDSIEETGFKIIIVNDGSTDGSDIICKQFQQTHPNVLLINKANGGLSDARNAAYNYIDTEYVFFLDSDDYIDAEQLGHALDFTIQNDLDWAQCGFVYKYDAYSLLNNKYQTETIISKQDAIHQLIEDSYIKNFAWGKIYKTAIIRQLLFPKGKYFEDVLWQYMVLSKSHKLGVFPSIVCYYRQRMDSISGKLSVKNLDILEGLKDRLNHIAIDYPIFEPLAAFNLWKLCNQFMSIAKTQNDKCLEQRFLLFNQALIANYEKIIRKNIDSKPILKRLLYRAIMEDKWYYKLIEIVERIIDRISIDKEYKVLRND